MHRVPTVIVAVAVALLVVGAGMAEDPEHPTIVIETDRASFHWAEAGIGAAAALAVVVLAFAPVLLLRSGSERRNHV